MEKIRKNDVRQNHLRLIFKIKELRIIICRKSFKQLWWIISLTIARKIVWLMWKRTFVDTRIIHDRLCTDRSTLGSSTLGAVTRILSCLRSSRKCSFTQLASLRNIELAGTKSSISSTSSLQRNNPKPQTRFRHTHTVSQTRGFVAILYPILKNKRT